MESFQRLKKHGHFVILRTQRSHNIDVDIRAFYGLQSELTESTYAFSTPLVLEFGKACLSTHL